MFVVLLIAGSRQVFYCCFSGTGKLTLNQRSLRKENPLSSFQRVRTDGILIRSQMLFSSKVLGANNLITILVHNLVSSPNF